MITPAANSPMTTTNATSGGTRDSGPSPASSGVLVDRLPRTLASRLVENSRTASLHPSAHGVEVVMLVVSRFTVPAAQVDEFCRRATRALELLTAAAGCVRGTLGRSTEVSVDGPQQWLLT